MIPNRVYANVLPVNRPGALPTNAARLATFASDPSRYMLTAPMLARRRKRDRDEAEEWARFEAKWLEKEEAPRG
jgi:hypothetical protein